LPTLRDDTREPLDLLMNTGMSVHLRTTLTVPHALTVTPPIPVVVDRPFARFESKYTVAPGLLTVDRTLAIKSPQVAVDQIEAYRAFTRTLETDYGQDFAIDPMVSAGAKPAAGDAQTLAADGAKKLDARDYSAAIDLLRQAVALDPAHKSAWNNLGRALAASRQYPQAVEAYDKQLAVNPYDEYAYNNKGLALQTLGRFEEAERAFRKQIEVSPLDEHAHTNLGVMLLDRGRPAEAEAELTTASQIDPENAWVLVRLGRARLMVGHTDEAVATFDRAVVKSGSPPIWNDIAYFLAEKGVRLDRAREYAMRAVDLTLAVLKHVKVDALDNSYLGAMASIANYWDTLGWVEYRLGHLTVARDYVDASWRLAQSEVVGDHLVTLLTALDETAKAASLRELLHPGHAAAKAPLDVVDREGNLTKARTLMVPASPETPKYTGEVWIVHNGTGQVVEARPIAAGDAAGAAATALLRRVVFPPAPGDQGVMLLRQGVLACPKAGDSCSFILKRPQDVQVLTQ
jgi:tetratricopeptide (TPR) repeat protein